LGRRVYTFTVMIQTRKSQQFASVLRPNYAIISSVSEPFKRRRLCSRIRIFLFSHFKKRDFLLFFWNDVSKSHKKSLASFVLNPSKWVHILREVITVIHFIYLFVSLVHLRTFITFTTHSSKLHSFLWMWSPHFWAKMFDVGDLPVLTFGNCVLKTRVIKWPLKLYGRFFTFSAFFFEIPKHDFLRFLSCRTRFLERWSSSRRDSSWRDLVTSRGGRWHEGHVTGGACYVTPGRGDGTSDICRDVKVSRPNRFRERHDFSPSLSLGLATERCGSISVPGVPGLDFHLENKITVSAISRPKLYTHRYTGWSDVTEYTVHDTIAIL